MFDTIKKAVTVRQAAEYCGLKVERGNMCCCPFHMDKTPSMKLNQDYFYCFGCHEHGDAVALTARLMKLSQKDAALQLAQAFHIAVPDARGKGGRRSMGTGYAGPDLQALSARLAAIRVQAEAQNRQARLKHAEDVLAEYLRLLRQWRDRYTPAPDETEWHPLFVEACLEEAEVEELLEKAHDPLECDRFTAASQMEVERIEKRLREYRAAEETALGKSEADSGTRRHDAVICAATARTAAMGTMNP